MQVSESSPWSMGRACELQWVFLPQPAALWVPGLCKPAVASAAAAGPELRGFTSDWTGSRGLLSSQDQDLSLVILSEEEPYLAGTHEMESFGIKMSKCVIFI